MFKIKKLNSISDAVCDFLTEDCYDIREDHESYDAILVRSAKCHGMAFPEGTVAIARAGAGVNNIPIDECTQKGIVVFNTPGANANGVKELVLAGMLLASRNVIKRRRGQRPYRARARKYCRSSRRARTSLSARSFMRRR
jgi:D-3-phosphoglycerate dehydrogenase